MANLSIFTNHKREKCFVKIVPILSQICFAHVQKKALQKGWHHLDLTLLQRQEQSANQTQNKTWMRGIFLTQKTQPVVFGLEILTMKPFLMQAEISQLKSSKAFFLDLMTILIFLNLIASLSVILT